MPAAIVTGSGGLIGSESVGHFVEPATTSSGSRTTCAPLLRAGGVDRADHGRSSRELRGLSLRRARHPRRRRRRARSSRRTRDSIELVVHTAAQPSHDWAARDPQTDFGVNANGTLNLLEATRAHCPDAPFIFCSTNKVYGDTPNACR